MKIMPCTGMSPRKIQSRFGIVVDLGLKRSFVNDREFLLDQIGKKLYARTLHKQLVYDHKQLKVFHRLHPEEPFIQVATNRTDKCDDLDSAVLDTIISVQKTLPQGQKMVVTIDPDNKMHLRNGRYEVPLPDGRHSNFFDMESRFISRGPRQAP